MVRMPLVLFAVAAVLFLSGCGALPLSDVSQFAFTAAGPQAWIDAPLPGQTLDLAAAPFQVVVHGNAPAGVSGFELSVNGQALASANPPDGDQPFAYVVFEWTPPAPGTYLLSARAQAGGTYGAPAQAQVVVVAEGEDENRLSPTAPSEPTACLYTALVNLFCRSGPGRVYPELDSFVAGQAAQVVGILGDQTHVQVLGPNFGMACFVPLGEEFGQLGDGCQDLPVVTAPPTPTYTPSPTPEPLATSTPKPTRTPVPPQCSDGLDNDGDGRADLADPQCRTANDNDEANP
jgi:hypothetical protein